LDLDDLNRRHRASLVRAATAPCATSRLSHQGVADFYADLICAEKHRRHGEPVRVRLPGD
jgi:hypothetical protein